MKEHTFWLGLVATILFAGAAGYLIFSWRFIFVDWSLVLLFAAFSGGAYLFFFQSLVKR